MGGKEAHKNQEEDAEPVVTLETSKDPRILGISLECLSPNARFVIMVLGVFGAFIPYGYVQESIFKVDGFTWALYISFVQYCMYTAFGLIEGAATGDTAARAPLHTYLRLSLCLVASFTLSNKACIFLNYPTKVVLKSSKMIPAMIIGKLWFNKAYSGSQYLATVLLLLGIVMFSLADVSLSDSTTSMYHVWGLSFMALSITFEAMGQQFQEDTIDRYKSTERELVFFNSIFGTGILAILAVIMGEFAPAFEYCMKFPHIYVKILLLSVLGYVGTVFFLAIMRTSGVFVAMSVGTTRKLFTIMLSFVFFPKPFVVTYLVAGIFAFSGIALNIYIKNKPEIHQLLDQWFGTPRKVANTEEGDNHSQYPSV